MIRVYLTKDVEKIGFAGEIVNVKEGFAMNFLIPKKLGVIVTQANETNFLKNIKVVQDRKEAIKTKSSMLAEKIKGTKIVLKTKIHDDNKLYGAVSAQDVVDLLSRQGISVSKNQVIFGKNIKTTGSFDITIKLSNSLQPACTLKVEAL